MITSAVGIPLLTGYAIGVTVFFLKSFFELTRDHRRKTGAVLATLVCAGIWPIAIVLVLLARPRKQAH